MIDLDCQNTSDELAIDYSKLEKVKANLDLIFELFKTCIEFGKKHKMWTSFFDRSNLIYLNTIKNIRSISQSDC